MRILLASYPSLPGPVAPPPSQRIVQDQDFSAEFTEDHKRAKAWFDSKGFPRPMRGDIKEANWFWDMSTMAFKKELWDEAWAGFHWAYALFSKNNDEREMARCLWRLGTTYKRKGSNGLACHCLSESLRINRSLNDAKAVAVLLFELGEAYILSENPTAAEPLLREAVERLSQVDPEAKETARSLLERIGSKQGARVDPKAILREAQMYDKGNNLEKAANCYLQAARAGLEQGDYSSAGDAGYFGHSRLLKLGRREDAAALLCVSAEGNTKIGKKYETGAALARLGRVLVDIGKKDDARRTFEQCIAVLEAAGASAEDTADVEERLRAL